MRIFPAPFLTTQSICIQSLRKLFCIFMKCLPSNSMRSVMLDFGYEAEHVQQFLLLIPTSANPQPYNANE